MLKELQVQLAEVLRQKDALQDQIDRLRLKGRSGTHHDDEMQRLLAIERRLRASIKEVRKLSRKEILDNAE